MRIKLTFDPALLRWLNSFRQRCNWSDFSRTTAIKAPLLIRSAELIAELVERERLDCEYAARGTLHVYRNEQVFAASSWYPRTLAKVGIPIDVLDGEQIQLMEPALKDGVVGGYFNSGDAQLRPDRFVAELARVVRERGGQIEEEARVDTIAIERGRISRVRTTSGDYSAREVVFALGAWSPKLAASIGLRLPIQPGKGYSITYSRPTLCPRMALTLKEASVCVTAWDSGYRLGSTMEFAGFDASLNPIRLDALRRAAAVYLREPQGPTMQEEWCGWRPMTPDDLPILGRVQGIDNLCMATGHGMLGVTMSAVTGLLVSEVIAGEAPSIDLAPFSLSRFG